MNNERYYRTFKVRKDKAVTIPRAVQAALEIDNETVLVLEFNRIERTLTYRVKENK